MGQRCESSQRMRSTTYNHDRERLVVQTYVIHDVRRVIVSAWFRRHALLDELLARDAAARSARPSKGKAMLPRRRCRERSCVASMPLDVASRSGVRRLCRKHASGVQKRTVCGAVSHQQKKRPTRSPPSEPAANPFSPLTSHCSLGCSLSWRPRSWRFISSSSACTRPVASSRS